LSIRIPWRNVRTSGFRSSAGLASILTGARALVRSSDVPLEPLMCSGLAEKNGLAEHLAAAGRATATHVVGMALVGPDLGFSFPARRNLVSRERTSEVRYRTFDPVVRARSRMDSSGAPWAFRWRRPKGAPLGRRGITATRTTQGFGSRVASAWCCAPGFGAIVSGAPRPPVPADLPRRRQRVRTKIGALTSLPPKTNRSRRVSRCAQSTPQEIRSDRRQLRGLPRSAHQASFDDR